jgi:hypothetical protein
VDFASSLVHAQAYISIWAKRYYSRHDHNIQMPDRIPRPSPSHYGEERHGCYPRRLEKTDNHMRALISIGRQTVGRIPGK